MLNYIRLNKLFLVLITSLIVCPVFADTTDTHDYLAKKWLYALTSDTFAGRQSGTRGCKKACSYIKSQVRSMGLSPEIQRFKFNGATFRNIIVPLGKVKDTVIVIGAHYDGQYESTIDKKYPAADDNASGVVTVLLLLKLFQSLNVLPKYPILFCFWDGEELCYGDIFKGSKKFVKNNKYKVLFYINVDAIGHDHNQTNTMSFLHRGNGIADIISEFVKSKAFTFRFFEAPKGFGSSDQVPFDAQDIPYVSFYDSPTSDHRECGHNLHSIYDTPDAVSIDRLVSLSQLIYLVLTKKWYTHY